VPSHPNPNACERNLSPQVGGTCINCRSTVWSFDRVTADVEAQLIAHIRTGHTVDAIRLLGSVSGRDLVDAKWMIEHMYGTAGIPLGNILDPGGTDGRNSGLRGFICSKADTDR
jgi:hypothetical protein